MKIVYLLSVLVTYRIYSGKCKPHLVKLENSSLPRKPSEFESTAFIRIEIRDRVKIYLSNELYLKSHSSFVHLL